MAAIPMTIVGILTTDDGATHQATLTGMAAYSDRGVGGGPMPPGSGGEPSHPIVPPGGYPGPGHPIVPPGGYPEPSHPIVIPPAPDAPPGTPQFPIWGPPGMEVPPGAGYPPVVGGGPIIGLPPIDPTPPSGGGDKPPPAGQGGWGYYDGRWGYFPGPGEASPK